MFVHKVCAVLSLVLVAATANDLDTGLGIMACAQKAILNGVPELNIPSHNPFVNIKESLIYNGEILGQSVSLNITNVTWGGLAQWKLSATQLSYDTDKEAVFDFKLHWDWLGLRGLFATREHIIIVDETQHGDFSIDLDETSWIGTINVTKPDSYSNGTVNAVHIDWKVKHVKTKINGLGLAAKPIEAAIGTTIMTALNTNVVSATVGDFIKMRLETIWWNTGKVWDLTAWCKANNQ